MDNTAASFQKSLDDYGPEAWRAIGSGKSLNDYLKERWEIAGVIPERWVLNEETKEYSLTLCTIFFKRPR